MNMFGLFYLSSDGCTYSCKILCGLFLTEAEAETALLEFIDRPKSAEWSDNDDKNLDNWVIEKIEVGKLNENGV